MNRVILASRSPRRRELLACLIPAERITVLPPRSPHEAGFDGLADWPSIESQLAAIARDKCDDVCAQLAEDHAEFDAVIAADTVIVGQSDDGQLTALGQPPETDQWQSVVKGWFRRYYLEKTHHAATAVCVQFPDGRRDERIVKTAVSMAAASDRLLDWYLTTGEPRGKAGGYAIQGAGSMFVSAIEGSLSNVIGLPLEAVQSLVLPIDE